MISKDSYELVKKAIKVHNRLKDRTYLILYKTSVKEFSSAMEVSILEENFWHLVGCKIDNSLNLTPLQKHSLYLKCVNGEDISSFIIYTRRPQDVSKKVGVILNTFDFIANAKQIRLSCTDNTPEAVMFKVGVGTNCGIIGYCRERNGMIPKTAQQKSIYKINPTASDKIYLIMSKVYGSAKYDTVEYVISKKVFPSIIDEFPQKIMYTDNIFNQYMETNYDNSAKN